MNKFRRMIFGLSGLNRTELLRILREIRSLCDHDLEESLQRLDVELSSIYTLMTKAKEADESDEEARVSELNVMEEIDNLLSELDRAERTLTQDFRRNSFYPTWATDFENDAAKLGADWSEGVRAKYKDKIEEIRKRASEFSKSYRERTVEESRKQLAELEQLLDGGVPSNSCELPDAGEFLHQMDSSWDERLKKLRAEEYQQLRTRASNVVEKINATFHLRTIAEVLENPAISTSKQKTQLKKLKSAQANLLKTGNMDEAAQGQLNAAMKALAVGRARKVLDDAEVAEAGDYLKKGAKLRSQAKTILKQDWATVFGKTAPLDNEKFLEIFPPVQS